MPRGHSLPRRSPLERAITGARVLSLVLAWLAVALLVAGAPRVVVALLLPVLVIDALMAVARAAMPQREW